MFRQLVHIPPFFVTFEYVSWKVVKSLSEFTAEGSLRSVVLQIDPLVLLFVRAAIPIAHIKCILICTVYRTSNNVEVGTNERRVTNATCDVRRALSNDLNREFKNLTIPKSV